MLAAGRYLPIYVVCIAPAALLWRRPVLLALVYACCSVALLAWRHRRADLVYFFVPFVLGPLGELFAVRAGAWSYAGALPLPLWLPFVWGIAGLFMKNLSEALAAPDRRIWRDRASRTSRPDAPVTEPGGSIDRRSNRTREASRS